MKFLPLILILIITNSYSQIISISNIEIIDDSTKKAQISIFDNNSNLIRNLDKTDIIINENYEKVDIININCPNFDSYEKLSTVLTIDVSGSMSNGGLEIAQKAATSWINKIFKYNDSSECAVTSFSDYSYIINNFTNNKNLLEYGINRLYPIRGTNYDEGFLGTNGGLRLASLGRYKKILVFLSDGYPNYYPDEEKIIDFANQNQITIYSVIIGYEAPYLIKKITSATGGLYFDNIVNEQQALQAYNQILKMSLANKPCEIIWKSQIVCGKIIFSYNPIKVSKTIFYNKPNELKPKIDLSCKHINFGIGKIGYNYDTSIVIKTHNNKLIIDSIISSDEKLTLLNKSINFPYELNLGDSLIIYIRYYFNSKKSEYSYLSIVSNTCENSIIDFIIFLDEKPNPIVKNNILNIAILSEFNNFNYLEFKSFNYGLGIQIYIMRNIAIRCSYGYSKTMEYSLLTDREIQSKETNFYSGNIKINLFINKNVLAYFAPFYMFENGTNTIEYHDKFTKSFDFNSYSIGFSIGGEFFIFHNLSISAETLFGFRKNNTINIIGFNNKIDFPIFNSDNFFIKPKFNFIISYFIN